MTAIPTTTLSGLTERYEVFFVDQFGVLRDDLGAYPGAIDALGRLKAAGKTVVILSNSGRSGNYNADRFVKLGFRRESFDHFVTSGDVAWAILSGPRSQTPAGSCSFTISSSDDRELADRLGMRSVETAAAADLIIISGSEAERISMETYAEMLGPAAERSLPCICTNPDIHKLVAGTTVPGAGSIARLYETLGGTVRWFGKPHRDIYAHALELCGNPERTGIVCIGDSIEHDICGAANAGLDSVLVATGILAEKSASEREAIMSATSCRPQFSMRAFAQS